MADILLLTQGTWGDIFPFVRIGNDLNARGHNVTLLSNEYFTEKIIQAGFDRNAAINIELFEEWNRKRNYPDNWESRLLHMKEQIGSVLSHMKKVLELLSSFQLRWSNFKSKHFSNGKKCILQGAESRQRHKR